MSDDPKRGVHDIGGLPGLPIDRHEHTPSLTELRIDAMMMLLRDEKRAFWRTDENRRTIESMTPEMYEGSAYYQRWVHAMRSLLVEKEVLSEAEIEAKLAEVRARHAGGTPMGAKRKAGGAKTSRAGASEGRTGARRSSAATRQRRSKA